MSSADDSYADFLGKANQDTGSEKAKSDAAKKSGKGGVQLKSVDKGLQVPKKLASVDAVFESEGEEAFEGVALRYEGGKLDSDSFGELVGHTGEVEELSTKKFDPRGDYKDVISLVEKEVDGGVKVFRIQTDRARVEYYVVGVKDGKILGVKARAIES